MLSSIVKAGMRAITPKKTMEANAEAPVDSTLTPKQFSQASIATPSTASTVDITANTTLDSITLQQIGNPQVQTSEKQADIGDAKPPTESTAQTTTNNTTTTTTETTTTTAQDLWQVLDTQLRSNIGTSVRCAICFSTVSDPVRTPCSHGFCRSCITGYLRLAGTDKCPECKAPCTRRSLETFSELDEMADSYKGMLRAFGLAPGIYTPEITTMTQKVVDVGGGSAFGDDEDLTEPEAQAARLDRLCVSATYQKALPQSKSCSKMQLQENEQVVQANLEACFGNECDDREAMDNLLESRIQSANDVNQPTESFSQALPNTQDVQEQAREQLEADREMQESMQEQNEEDNDYFTLRQQDSKKDSNKDPFELPKEPEASPPNFADSATKALVRSRKSFSKRDRPSFEGLSPIDHEASFETRLSTTSKQSLGVTNVLEDSRGGMHMMDFQDSPHDDKEGNDLGDDDDDDKTIAFTMDDSPGASRSSSDEHNHNNNNNGNNNDNANENDNDGNESNKNEESPGSNSSEESKVEYFPLTYDPIGHPTEITKEYHTSTKNEISNAANLPAGQNGQRLKTKKKLFATPNDEKKKPATRKSRRKATTSWNEDSLANMEDSNPPADSDLNHDIQAQDETEDLAMEFPIGTIVRVQARTWPGVNKQGGVGRITCHNPDGTYNVAYVLGGKESKIDAVFVSKEDQGDCDLASDTANRKRSRRAKDSLPEELLKQLAAEGFDVPGVKAKTQKKPKTTKTLGDSTNQRTSKRKRGAVEKASVDDIPKRGRSKQHLSERQVKTTRRRKDQYKSEDERLPTTVKKAPPTQATIKKKAAKKTVTWNTEPREKTPPVVTENFSVDEEKYKTEIRIAESAYKERIENAIQNKTLVAVSSNLSKRDEKLFASTLGLQVMKSSKIVDDNTDICIVPSKANGDNSLASVRTLKVMLSALRGIPLVTPDWLRACCSSKEMVVPQNFLRSIPTKQQAIETSGDAICGVTRLVGARRNNQLPFHNMFACLCGGYEGNAKASIQELLEAGGAKILSTSPEVEAKLQEINSNGNVERILVVCGNSGRGFSSRKSGIKLAASVTKGLKELLEHRQEHQESAPAMIVDSQWVIESVTCAKAMAPNLFEPSIFKDLWTLCL